MSRQNVSRVVFALAPSHALSRSQLTRAALDLQDALVSASVTVNFETGCLEIDAQVPSTISWAKLLTGRLAWLLGERP